MDLSGYQLKPRIDSKEKIKEIWEYSGARPKGYLSYAHISGIFKRYGTVWCALKWEEVKKTEFKHKPELWFKKVREVNIELI